MYIYVCKYIYQLTVLIYNYIKITIKLRLVLEYSLIPFTITTVGSTNRKKKSTLLKINVFRMHVDVFKILFE